MEVRDQQIVVITDFTENSRKAFKHAQVLAEILEKGLYLACFVQEDVNEEQAKAALHTFARDTNINTYLIKGNNKNSISTMIDSISAILIVLTSNTENPKNIFHPKRILKILKHSRVPYLFVNSDIKNSDFYNKVILPIDSTRESKEKVLWASYFGRFNNAFIHVISSYVKDEYLNRQLRNNLKFIRKIFSNFEVNYEIHETNQKENSFWLNYIYNSDYNRLDVARLAKYVENVDKLTKNDIKEAAKQYLKKDKVMQFVLNPEK